MGELAKNTASLPLVNNSELMAKAIESNNIDALERLMALQERWDANNAKKQFIESMADFQSRCPIIIKTKQAHNYKYAPIEDIVSQIGDLISECGFSYRFEQEHDENGNIGVTCVVTHISGHSERLRMFGERDQSGSKNAIQSIGSTVTYLKRYTLTGSFGIATADSDLDGRADCLGGEAISMEQSKEIDALIKETNSDKAKFLNWLKVKSVDEIPAAKYKRAISALKAKLK